jgi:hypothetical protein
MTVNGINCCHCSNICFLCPPFQPWWNISSVKADYSYAHIVLNFGEKMLANLVYQNATSTSESNMHND